MRNITLLLLLFFSFSTYSQDSLQSRTRTRSFVPIGYFKTTGKVLTKKDSLNFVIRGNDTLVPVPENFTGLSSKNGVKVEYEPKSSAFLEVYKEIVFGNQLENVEPEQTMKIWKEDVKILFDSTVPPEQRKALLEFAEEISSGIDSLRIYETENRKESNYFIYYKGREDEFDFEPRIRNSSGGYYLSWNEKQQLYRGVLKINTYAIESPKEQLNNLKYYFLKSLGRFYYSEDLPCESYFSGCPLPREFTEMDYQILKYHYSYGICKGVDMQTFEELHRQMKEQLAQDPNAKLYLVHPE